MIKLQTLGEMMTATRMALLIPTRSRPANLDRLLHALADTDTSNVDVYPILDLDDPKEDEYQEVLLGSILAGPPRGFQVQTLYDKRHMLATKLNRAAERVFSAEQHSCIGFMGDDHVPRTERWDVMIRGLPAPFIAYGNDLHQGPALPTSVFMSAYVYRTLGSFCPGGMEHMYIDDAWKKLGESAGILRY